MQGEPELGAMKNKDVSFEPTFREKAVRRIGKFVKKNRKFYFFGVIAVAAVVFVTALFSAFYDNRKRILSIACILLFFVSSSSFSYPVLPMDVSFVSDSIRSDDSSDTDYIATEVTNDKLQDTETISLGSQNSSQDNVFSDDQSINENAEEDLKYDGNGELLGEVSESDQISISEILDSSDDLSPYDEESGTCEQAQAEDKQFSADDWNLMLVNKQHPIPDNYEFETAQISSGGKLCDERILSPLRQMFEAAARDGVSLVVCSPYRSNNRQEMLFARKVDYYLEQGYDYMQSYALASQAVTIPGSSEHEIGLALDIITDGYCSLDEGFGDTAAGRWLAQNSYKYGFVVRYLKGKEEITGIEYEPWHIRYVGVAAATVMYEEGICLEEFWDEYLY